MEFWGPFAGETIPHILFLILMIGLCLLPFAVIAGVMYLPQLIKDDRRRSLALPIAAIILVALGVFLSYVKLPGRGPWVP
jgi:ABC-type uncharacterized transport system permease subunit